jgi:hypothetical protein
MRPSPWRCSDHDESYIPSKERSPLLWETFSSSYNGTVWLTPRLPVSFDVAEDPAQEGIWTDFSWSSQ